MSGKIGIMSFQKADLCQLKKYCFQVPKRISLPEYKLCDQNKRIELDWIFKIAFSLFFAKWMNEWMNMFEQWRSGRDETDAISHQKHVNLSRNGDIHKFFGVLVTLTKEN